MARRLALVLGLFGLVTSVLAATASARSLSDLIAPTSVCADQTDGTISVARQEQAMRCMTNFARERTGLAPLGDSAELDRSAAAKAKDIVRCDSFSHQACGREFTYWMGRVGYLRARCWRAGENIGWRLRRRGDVRSIFVVWMHSREHRGNILGSYAQLGIGLAVGRLDGHASTHVWTQHFGSHCGADRRSHEVARLAAARALR